jgi:hypothetical protein
MGDETSANEEGGLPPGDETNANKEEGGVTLLPGDETHRVKIRYS